MLYNCNVQHGQSLGDHLFVVYEDPVTGEAKSTKYDDVSMQSCCDVVGCGSGVCTRAEREFLQDMASRLS